MLVSHKGPYLKYPLSVAIITSPTSTASFCALPHKNHPITENICKNLPTKISLVGRFLSAITILCTGDLCDHRLSLCAEFRCRERHGMEYTARIIVLRRNTFLVGHGIFCRIDKVLSRTNDPHHREKSDGDGKILSASVTVIQNTVYFARHR